MMIKAWWLLIAFISLMFLSMFGTPVLGNTLLKTCQLYQWACAVSESQTPVDFQTIVKINREVNSEVRPVTDLNQYGVPEVWSLPTARGGDCEDYALLKKKRLVEAGVAPQDLMLAVVLNNHEFHAVLVYNDGNQLWTLDNLTDSIRPTEKVLLIQSSTDPTVWTTLHRE